MFQKPEDLYLNLIKKTLAFTLWPEPPTVAKELNSNSPLRKTIFSTISNVLKSHGFLVMRISKISQEDRELGLGWPGYADSMIGLKRLDNIQYCVETILKENIPGDLIETGVWRGGACILMRAILSAYKITDRKIYVADSFEGLPKPDVIKYPADEGATWHLNSDYLSVSQEQVEKNFERYELLDDQVIFLKGWFKNTLPFAPIEALAILRLDGDMYESTMDSLTNLYSKLSLGGFCIIDDYGLEGCGCKNAVDDFRAKQEITTQMVSIDWAGVYWRKE